MLQGGKEGGKEERVNPSDLLQLDGAVIKERPSSLTELSAQEHECYIFP